MADFDPMLLATRYNRLAAPIGSYDSLILNGPLEKWTNTAALADYWTSYTTWTGITLARTAETRSAGNGLYTQRIQATGYSAGGVYHMSSTYVMRGHMLFDAIGHKGQRVYASAWIRNAGSSPGNFQGSVLIEEVSSTDVVLTVHYGTPVSLSASWIQVSHNDLIAYANCAWLRVTVRTTCVTIGANPDIRVDDVELYEAYTIVRNPAMPDEQDVDFPGRIFSRTIGGTLLRGRSAAMTAKFDKVLHFGLISKTQVQALRSLYLHDCPMEWTPNHPLLPSLMEVRWIGEFNSRLISPSAGTNHHSLDMHLVEY